jgi:hypothetical protein
MKSNLLLSLVVLLSSSMSLASSLYQPYKPVAKCYSEISLSKIDRACAALGAKTLEFQNFSNQEVKNAQLLKVENCWGGRENNYQSITLYTYAAKFTDKRSGKSVNGTSFVVENKFPSLSCLNGQYFGR